jgi:adenylate cyclase
MLRPAQPHEGAALRILDIASRAWLHGADAFAAACEAIRAEGVALECAELHMTLSHPLLRAGRARWDCGVGGSWAVSLGSERVEERAAERQSGTNPLYRSERAAPAMRDLVDALDPALVEELRSGPSLPSELLAMEIPGIGATAVGCLEYGAPQRSVVVFTTRAPEGFGAEDLRILHTALWGFAACSRATRWRALCHILAQVYIGPQTGIRVLHGQLQRGDLERRNAVIWFSDLRGFTEMSVRNDAETVVLRLNEVFETIGRSVAVEGGEILKFIGDAVLAIFPYADERDAADAVRRAVRAARACQASLPQDLDVGIGLHRGEVAYGNIGASARLDFTVIGTPVNVASRIEGLCGRLDARILASSDIAAIDASEWTSAGAFPLKGIPGQTEVFRPALPL